MGFGGELIYKYNSASEKAASLLHSLIKNHGFHNGNKRTALVASVRFLDINKYNINCEEQEYFKLVVDIARGFYPEEVADSDGGSCVYISLVWWKNQKTGE